MYRHILIAKLLREPGYRPGRFDLGYALAPELEAGAHTVYSRIRADMPRLTAAHPEFSTCHDHDGSELLFDPATARPSLEQIVAELTADIAAHNTGVTAEHGVATLELLAAVLVQGQVYSYYGNSVWGREFDTLHLLICGIDWTQFEGVEMDTWTTFAGTFAEDTDRTQVLAAKLCCRCDHEIEVAFGLATETITKVFALLPTGVIHELFTRNPQ